MNDILLDALHCRNAKRVPVWLMRQAGRYMPQYRALRAKHSFLELCHNPELIAEVTMQPINAFGMDAAIIFSDILVIPEAMGIGLRFDDGVGPIIERPIESAADLDKLFLVNIRESLHYVEQGIKLVQPELKVPLIGFCGAPFTLASYMIEGKSSRDFHKTKKWMLSDPESFHRLLSLLADYAIEYLNMQIDAGVQAVQIFDSWANALAYNQFQEFSLAYMQKIIQKIKPRVPLIVFCKGASTFASNIAKINPSCISMDLNANIANLRPLIPSSIAIQGNLDPDYLYAPIPVLQKEVTRILDAMHGDHGYIFNLAHGVTPGVPVDAVRALVDCVKGYK